MKAWAALTTCALFLFPTLGLAGESIGWKTDLAAAQAETLRTGRILMVDVYTDWCSWCKKLDSDTYGDPKVVAKARDFVPLKLNPEASEAGAKFAEKYSVTGYPTILFLDAEGSVVNRIGGYMEAGPFAAAMAKTLENASRIKSYLAEFQSGKYQNAEALLSMLLETGRTGEARPVFDRLQRDAGWDAARRGSAALAIARSLADGEDYRAALDYLKIVEELGPKTGGALEARWMHAVSLFHLSGKKQSLGYLDGVLKDKGTPKDWTVPLQDLRKRINEAKEPGRN